MMPERDYEAEYERYHSSKQAIAHRAMRNAARRRAGLKKGDGKEVDHVEPLSSGGSNSEANTRVVSRNTNRVKGNR